MNDRRMTQREADLETAVIRANAQVEELERRAQQLSEQRLRWCNDAGELTLENGALEAEVERLRKERDEDTGRIKMLSDQLGKICTTAEAAEKAFNIEVKYPSNSKSAVVISWLSQQLTATQEAIRSVTTAYDHYLLIKGPGGGMDATVRAALNGLIVAVGKVSRIEQAALDAKEEDNA